MYVLEYLPCLNSFTSKLIRENLQIRMKAGKVVRKLRISVEARLRLSPIKTTKLRIASTQLFLCANLYVTFLRCDELSKAKYALREHCKV